MIEAAIAFATANGLPQLKDYKPPGSNVIVVVKAAR